MSNEPANPQPSWRKPAGMFLILALIAGWTAIVVSLSPWVGSWPALVRSATPQRRVGLTKRWVYTFCGPGLSLEQFC